MIRHIVVEGPDGSGKSGMVDRLVRDLSATIHPRASTSRGGPIADITSWHLIDMEQLEDGRPYGPWVYDRHPLISERIYAMCVRNTNPQGKYSDLDWVITERERLAKHVLMVWCLPPKSHVFANVNRNASEQMPGVVNNIGDVYRKYSQPNKIWPGRMVWWDYTTMNYPTWLNELKNAMMART